MEHRHSLPHRRALVAALTAVVLLMVAAPSAGRAAEAGAVTPPVASLVDPSVGPSWGPAFHPSEPTRLLDSRTTTGGFGGPVGPGQSKDLQVTGLAGVGPGAVAVALNVTVTAGTAPSFVTLYPAGDPVPTASTVNFGPGQTIANSAVTRLSAEGKVSVFNANGAVHVVIDIVGWFDDGSDPGDLWNPVGPTRILDTRTATGGWGHKLGAGDANITTLSIAGVNGVPKTAHAVVLNVTATNSDAGSFVQVWPSDSPRPTTSNLNFGPGQTIANLVTTRLEPSPLATNGSLSFFNAVGTTDLVVDLVGYYDPTQGANFHPLTPTRVLDDRVGTGSTGPWGPGEARSLTIAGTHGIPANATGIVGNLTATNATTGSWAALSAPIGGAPTTSNLNFAANETIANLSYGEFGASGDVSLYNELGHVDLVLDIAGYFDGDTKVRPIYYTDLGGGIAWKRAGASLSALPAYFIADSAPSYPVPGDYDGDGRWEPATVDATGAWITAGGAGTISFPPPGPLMPEYYRFNLPVPGDYDGNGRTVPAWYRDVDGTWFIQGHAPIQFGDGPTDPSTPTNPLLTAQVDQDVPVPADYDGDGITDLATYRPGAARWKIRRSSDGVVVTTTLGDPTKLTFPVPADYDGVGHAQVAAYDGVSAWLIAGHASPASTFGTGDWGFPWAADFDGAGHAQLSYISYTSTGTPPAMWRLEGYAQGQAAGPGSQVFPVGFGADLWVNVARLTFVSRCVGPPHTC